MFAQMGDCDEDGLARQDAAYRPWARERMARGELVGWVVEDDAQGAVASGVLWLQPVQPSPSWTGGAQPYLMSMYTEPAARGRGHATAIVQEALAWAKARGFPRLALHASSMGRPVYERLGFERTWEMRKAL